MEDSKVSFAVWFPIGFVQRGAPVGNWKEDGEAGSCGLVVFLDQGTLILSRDPLYTAPGSGSHAFSGPSGPRHSIR